MVFRFLRRKKKLPEVLRGSLGEVVEVRSDGNGISVEFKLKPEVYEELKNRGMI